ncbi:MAG: LysM peptidoglycan-binding domain-containing protein [Planctomycetes bacterium]|jgi:hypothetical protein|nr:LysM peptidoglycan-binding domain-containing protein [Planctomycetota bacterium]MCL4729570.1 LysM peptidoglycan-binding domain-containing protein [Planctomycetota bacterium]
MRNNILTLLVGFVVMCGLVLLFKVGLDKMTDAEAAPADAYASMNVDINRRAILYRVQPGDTLWSLADRFYGNGRRWNEIASANDIAQGQGLQSGSVIKIPLAPGDAQPAVETIPPAAAATASYDDIERTLVPAFAVDENALDNTLLRIDAEAYPAGVFCVARTTESGAITLAAYDAAGSIDAPAIAVYEAPKGQQLAELRADDYDGDGSQEIYTIWLTDNVGPISRVLRIESGRIVMVCETHDDPVALARLRNR